MLSAVIFDMDGVLVDSEPHHHAFESALFARLGITVSDAQRRGFVGLAGDVFWERLREIGGLHQSTPALLALDRTERLAYFAALNHLEPISGVRPLLEELRSRGIPRAVASSSSPALISLMIDRLGLKTFFTHLVSGEQVARGKPRPDIFLHTAQLLDIPPAQCLVIEDSANGATAARAAGMYCLGFRNSGTGGGQNLSPAHRIVDDFSAVSVDDLMALVP